MYIVHIKSNFNNVFVCYGLELITSCGIVQCHKLYVSRSRAEENADYFYTNGWYNSDSDTNCKVYQVNIVEFDCLA